MAGDRDCTVLRVVQFERKTLHKRCSRSVEEVLGSCNVQGIPKRYEIGNLSFEHRLLSAERQPSRKIRFSMDAARKTARTLQNRVVEKIVRSSTRIKFVSRSFQFDAYAKKVHICEILLLVRKASIMCNGSLAVHIVD